MPDAFFEGSIARALLTTLPSGAQCFVGNSLAIRAVDAFGGMGETPLTLHGNRGASGIDGNLATAAGIAAATGRPVAALVGDQTLLHDATSLALLAEHNAIVVLLDNGGGHIFDHLPFASVLPPDVLAHGWHAPGRVAFAALASAYGFGYRQVRDAASLRAAMEQGLAGGAWLLHVVIDAATSRAAFAA